jgi:desulfoferrodoxin (superoxide reductase-like protein)
MNKQLKFTAPLIAILYLTLTPLLFANKTSVEIRAPQEVNKGAEVTVTIEVSHNGNNILHYTNWVYVKVNGKEYKRWEFSSFNRPVDEKFNLSFKIIVNEPLKIEAEGNCNIHGSQGKKTIEIGIK